MASEQDLGAALEAFLAGQMPAAEEIVVSGLHRATQGLSRENWPFDLSWREGGEQRRQKLLLRRDPVGSVLETDRRLEFAILKGLEGTAVPAPRVLFLDAAGEAFGRPAIVMERRAGVCDYFVLNGGALQLPAADRLQLARRLCDCLAGIHAVDWRALGIEEFADTSLPPGALRELAWWEAYLAKQILEPQPEMTFVAGWLRRHAPAPRATVLVHGDFKPGNVLLKPEGGIDSVLDWEIAHAGDPMEDLGWVTNPYRAGEHIIPGAWEVADLVAHYSERTGLDVDLAELPYWHVFTNFKLAAIVLTGVRSACEQRSDRVMAYRNVRGFLRRLLDLLPVAA